MRKVLLALGLIGAGVLSCVAVGPAAAQTLGLSRGEVGPVQQQAWTDYARGVEALALQLMLDDGVIRSGGLEMPISVELIWDEGVPVPDAGYPVFISMHGGGAFTEAENHDQWDIQKTRYPGVRGLYICPHSPMDTWDQWHHESLFPLIDTLVRAVMLRGDIDPNRIYLSGYCSGGNGVYQLGPVLADHFAAVSATKALSQGAPLENLRNCPIDLQWGEHDEEPVNRPEHNRANVDRLYRLQADDPAGYRFREIEHWRQGRFVNDKSTVNWLARWTRDPLPRRVVWAQGGDAGQMSNQVRRNFYWLGLPEGVQPATDGRSRIDATYDRSANAVALTVAGYPKVAVYLNDQMLDLDRPVTITVNGRPAFTGMASRSEAMIRQSVDRRGDPGLIFSARVVVDVPGGG